MVAPQEVVEVIHRLRSCEAPVVAAEVRPVPPERHASSEKFDGFIPLQNIAKHTDRAVSVKGVCVNIF